MPVISGLTGGLDDDPGRNPPFRLDGGDLESARDLMISEDC
jgi:hypothetical protein